MAKFNFQSFDKESTPLHAQPMVTLQKKGLLSLNRAAVEALGNAEAVEALYDGEARAIGLRRLDPNASNASRIRVHPNGYGYRMSLQRLCSYYGIEATKNLRYAPSMDEGILVIELDKPLGETRGTSRKQKKELQDHFPE